ncbi:MAG: ferredoxin [Spirochaetaceae bacterium]|nr:MAG: ferredoxin [Spirochaetaceae bacterium]
MADKNSKVSGNVPGPFYVDSNCIGCEACAQTDPDHYVMDDSGTFAYVFKQPESDAEREAALDGQGVCPVDAIGDDG